MTCSSNASRTLPDERVIQVISAIDEHRQELVQIAQRLIQISSENPRLSDRTPGGESHVQDYVDTLLPGIGATTDRWEPLPGRPNLVGTVPGSGGGRSLALNGHVDVVPAGDRTDWSFPPYAAEIHDGMIYGRGALDMKGGSGLCSSPP